MKRKVTVKNKFQKNYSYEIVAGAGKKFDSEFKPELTPKQMLKLGVFGGDYFIGKNYNEFPASWFKGAKLSKNGKNPGLNFFKVKASQPLSVWKKKGWIKRDDPLGWFQWYCRYYLGRRLEKEDKRQIKRWKAINRHLSQIKKNCKKGDKTCRPKQRQAVLHWAYDSREI